MARWMGVLRVALAAALTVASVAAFFPLEPRLEIVAVSVAFLLLIAWGEAEHVARAYPKPRFVAAEVVPWQIDDPFAKTWCRVIVQNSGAVGDVRVRIQGVSPAFTVRGIGGSLHPMGSATGADATRLGREEPQKFDILFVVENVNEPGSRQCFISLVDGAGDNEPVSLGQGAYEVDVSVHGGERTRRGRIGIRVDANGLHAFKPKGRHAISALAGAADSVENGRVVRRRVNSELKSAEGAEVARLARGGQLTSGTAKRYVEKIARPDPPVRRDAAPEASAPTLEAQTRRYMDVSIDFLTKLAATPNITEAQAELLLAPYMSHWMRVEGQVLDVAVRGRPGAIIHYTAVSMRETPTSQHVTARFEGEPEHARTLQKDATVRVIGQLASAMPGGLALDNCELDED